MTIFIQLTIAGEDVGPFDLYSNIDAFVAPFDQNILRQSLIDGYLADAPDGAIQIKIQSTGDCTNYIIIDIVTPITTTSTSSTTSTTSTTSSTTSTTTTAIPTYYQIRECQSLADFLAEKTYLFSVGDVVEFDTIPTGGNLKPYCGTIIADDINGPLSATLSSGVTRTCDPPDPTHCYQAP